MRGIPRSGFLSGEMAFLALLLGVPLVLGLVGLWQVFKDREAKLREAYESRLEEMLSKVERAGQTGEFFTRVLRNLDKVVVASTNPQRTFSQGLSILKRRFPDTLSAVYLDAQGNPVPTLCDFPVAKIVLRKFFKVYQDMCRGSFQAFEKEKSLIQGVLGPLMPLSGEISLKVQEVNSSRRHFAFLSRPGPGGMFLVFLERNADWRTLAIRERITALNRHSHRLRMLVCEDFSQPEIIASFFGVAPRTLKKILSRFDPGFEALAREPGFLWGWLPVFNNTRVLWRLVLPGDVAPDEKIRRLGGVFFLGWLAMLLLAHWLFSRNPFFSIRLKMLLAFGYCAGMPLLIISFTALSFLQDLGESLEKKVHKNIERALQTFDLHFSNYVKGAEAMLRRQFKIRFSRPGMTTKDLAPIFTDLSKRFSIDLIRVFDREGKLIFERTGRSPQPVNRRGDRVFSRTASLLLRSMEVPTISVMPRSPITVGVPEIGDISGEQQLFFDLAAKGLGKIMTVDFLNEKFFNSFQEVYLPDENKRFLAMIWWEYEEFHRQYIQRNLLSFSRRLPETRLGALHLMNPSLSIPETYLAIPGFRLLADSGAILGGSLRKRLGTSQGPVLLTGFRARILENFFFLASTLDRSTRAELAKWQWRYGAIALLTMTISLIIGGLLSVRLLRPIGHLARGLTLIGEKNFSAVIPVDEPDEIGKVSVTFNRMMSGFADLELAHIVQETLFPQTPLRLGGWEVYGSCQSASQVGGDYFDYFPLDETSMAVIIGDVSGHGVSAALVVAMAKALVFHPESGRDPVRVLKVLHQVFLSVLKRKKMMTCLFLILDTATGTIKASNAGQCYPFRVSGGRAAFWDIPGGPVGVSKNLHLGAKEDRFVEQEVLVLYTDGLVEAPRLGGGDVGFETFGGKLPGLLGRTPRETEQNIRLWHESLTGPGSAVDDKTIVIVQNIKL